MSATHTTTRARRRALAAIMLPGGSHLRRTATLIAAAFIVALLVVPTEGDARVGGGQNYNSGRSSSSSSSSNTPSSSRSSSSSASYSSSSSSSSGASGGGGCAAFDGLLLLAFLGYVGFIKWKVRSNDGDVAETLRRNTPLGVVLSTLQTRRDAGGAAPGVTRQRPLTVSGQMRAIDENFSEPLFLDFAQLAYVQARTLAPRGQEEQLRTVLLPSARRALSHNIPSGAVVEDIIFGAVEPTKMQATAYATEIHVRFETNLTIVDGGRRAQLAREELWVFQREPGLLSPGPERMRALVCAGCGSGEEPGTDGVCPSCGTVRTGGKSQWVVSRISVLRVVAVTPPPVSLGGGGVEVGTNLPSILDPDLAAQTRALTARHPAFRMEAFERRARDIFMALQQAWTDAKWERARPFQTDALFQTHRFWMERYARFGLRNLLDQVVVTRVQVVKVEHDAFFESITVRIFASMVDVTIEQATGKVVGGDPQLPRRFSEYWTFIRRMGRETASTEAEQKRVDACPHCGAPLDQINMAGICGYCSTKITGGDFSWVLSRIEQDESYRG